MAVVDGPGARGDFPGDRQVQRGHLRGRGAGRFEEDQHQGGRPVQTRRHQARAVVLRQR